MITELLSFLASLGVQIDLAATQQMMTVWTLKAAIILGVLFIVSKLDNLIVKSIHLFERVKPLDEHTRQMVDKVLCYFIDFIAFLFILSLLNLKGALMTLLAGAGVFGLAIGFASKDVAANMISGLFVHIDKPFRIGDNIQIKSFKGTVESLNFRTTILKAKDKRRITLPNQMLAQSAVINFSTKKKRKKR